MLFDVTCRYLLTLYAAATFSSTLRASPRRLTMLDVADVLRCYAIAIFTI